MAPHSSSLVFGRSVSDIVSAYVANHAVEVAALPGVIRSVQHALAGIIAATTERSFDEKPHPAVPIKKSVFPSYIICLEDGKKLKMLKRHLKTAFNMEPEESRQRWGLPDNYPMIAPNYPRQRSVLARIHGLGHRPGARLRYRPDQQASVCPRLPKHHEHDKTRIAE